MGTRNIAYSELCILGDPRYLWHLAGTWLLDEIALNKLYCAVANAGADSQRLMPWTVWAPHPEGIKSQFAPYAICRDKFDLLNWNDYYFPIVRRVIEIAAAYDIKTWFCLVDNCQFHGVYRQWSPWITNVTGVVTAYDTAAYPHIKRWIEKCIYEFYDLDVGWCWGNETNPPSFRALAKSVIFPFLRDDRIDAENSTYGATMKDAPYVNGEYTGNAGVLDQLKGDVGEAFGDAAKLAIWKEVHGCGKGGLNALVPPNRVDQALTWWARPHDNGIRIWLSDDGVKDGTSACDRAEDGARTSAEMWTKLARLTMQYRNDFAYEHLPQSADMACQAATLKAIYHAIHGVYPPEKWHYEPPVPPEPPPPEPPEPPLPPEPKLSCYEKYIKDRPVSKWQLGKFIKCLFG